MSVKMSTILKDDLHTDSKNTPWEIIEKQDANYCEKNHKFQDEYDFLLTNRERDCLKKLLSGKTAKMAAKELNISSRTVESHLGNLKKKLHVRTKYELIIECNRLGFR